MAMAEREQIERAGRVAAGERERGNENGEASAVAAYEILGLPIERWWQRFDTRPLVCGEGRLPAHRRRRLRS